MQFSNSCLAILAGFLAYVISSVATNEICQESNERTKPGFLTVLIVANTYAAAHVISMDEIKALETDSHSFHVITNECENSTAEHQVLSLFLDEYFANFAIIIQVVSFHIDYPTNEIIANILAAYAIPFFILSSYVSSQMIEAYERSLRIEYNHVVVLNEYNFNLDLGSTVLMEYNVSFPAIIRDYKKENKQAAESFKRILRLCERCIGPEYRIHNKEDIGNALETIHKKSKVKLISVFMTDFSLLIEWMEQLDKYRDSEKIWFIYNELIPKMEVLKLSKYFTNKSFAMGVTARQTVSEWKVLINTASIVRSLNISSMNLVLNATYRNESKFNRIRGTVLQSVTKDVTALRRLERDDLCKLSEFSAEYRFESFHRNYNKSWRLKALSNANICKRICPGGYYSRSVENSSCCLECFPCQRHFIQPYLDRYQCQECPIEMTSNSNNTKCLHLTKKYTNLSDTGEILTITFLSISGFLISFLICLIFYRQRKTPVVKSSDIQMTIIQLSMHILAYVLYILQLIENTDIRNIAFNLSMGMCFTIILSIYLTKTFKLIAIFKAKSRMKSRNVFQAKGFSIMLLAASSNSIVSLLVYINFPEKLIVWRDDYDNAFYEGQETSYLFFGELFFLLILSLFCGIYSYKLRHLPSNYNEGRFIAPAMFVFVFILCATCVVHDMHGSVRKAFEEKKIYLPTAVMLFVANTAILMINYVYKVYIILYSAHKNTRSYFESKRMKSIEEAVDKQMRK